MTAENSLDRKVVWVESECLHVPPNSIVAAFFFAYMHVLYATARPVLICKFWLEGDEEKGKHCGEFFFCGIDGYRPIG